MDNNKNKRGGARPGLLKHHSLQNSVSSNGTLSSKDDFMSFRSGKMSFQSFEADMQTQKDEAQHEQQQDQCPLTDTVKDIAPGSNNEYEYAQTVGQGEQAYEFSRRIEYSGMGGGGGRGD